MNDILCANEIQKKHALKPCHHGMYQIAPAASGTGGDSPGMLLPLFSITILP